MPTPPTPRVRAYEALRDAVWPQIEAFRRKYLTPDATCALTKVPLAGQAVEVDHDPPFEHVVSEFCRHRGLRLENLAVAPGRDGQVITRLADRALEADWIDFHQRHARLRLVTRHTNQITLTRPLVWARRDRPEIVEPYVTSEDEDLDTLLAEYACACA